MKLYDYINSIKDKTVAVIGLGISNEPLIRLLLTENIDVTVCDKRSIENLGMKALEMINLGAKLRLGEDYLLNLNQDIIFRTPGVMPFDENLVKAKERGSVITSEMELFFRLCPCKTIAVTGSDGKTTTTTIISELLKEAGYKVHLGGNIGRPLLCELPLFKETDIAVVELSSFQLHSMVCSPDIAVITNISPNHLDKHLDYNDYINAKKQIFLNQKKDSILVLNYDDPIVSTFPGNRFFSVEREVEGTYLLNDKLYRNGRYLLSADEIFIPGLHNIKNFLAAFAATEDLVNDDICIKIAKTFKGVEHRLENVRTVNGVTFINDSIGSSPSRTIAGLKSMKSKPVVILGGYDKLIPFDSLAEAVYKYSKTAVLTGSTANKIASELEKFDDFQFYVIDNFDDAVRKSYELADEGDIVLFSPACASFDLFKNFEERGRYFKKLVMELN